jgi:hypothetical protein
MKVPVKYMDSDLTKLIAWATEISNSQSVQLTYVLALHKHKEFNLDLVYFDNRIKLETGR